MVRKLVVVFTSVVLFAAAHVKALGLGEIVLESSLNQPFSAQIALLQLGNVRPDQIQVQIANERDFARFSIERENFLNTIEFDVQERGDTAFVRLSTDEAVREPYLSFVLETRWPSGRLLNEYTVLLDLPAFANNANAAAIQQPVQADAAPEQTAEIQSPTSPSSSLVEPAPARFAAPAEPVAEELVVEEPVVAQPSRNANTSETVTIDSSDTLWDVALEVRPDSSVSVQQTMLALQSLNREAFIGDNINMVRRGQVLRVPTLEQIQALSAREAISEVARQNQLFENRRNVPLASQPITAQPQANNGAAPNRGELSVVSVEDAEPTSGQAATDNQSAELDARIASLEDALAVQREESDRAALVNEELTARLGLLEEQIASAQEIIRLRDLELAQLQEALAQAAAEEPEPVVEEVDPPTVITMAPEKSLVEQILDTLIANTLALVALVGLIILMLVFVLLRRNRAAEQAALADIDAMPVDAESEKAEQSDSDVEENANDEEVLHAQVAPEELDELFDLADDAEEHSEVSESDDEVTETEPDFEEFSETEEVLFEDEPSVQTQPEDIASFDEDDEVAELASEAEVEDFTEEIEAPKDILEEVDALLAYEKVDEAEVMLQNAIVAQPDRADIRMKMLEVLVAKQDPVGFKLQETEIRDMDVRGLEPRIATLRSQLDSELDSEILEDGEDDFFNELNELDDMEVAIDLEASAEVDDNKVLSGGQSDSDDDNSIEFGSADSFASKEDDIDFDLSVEEKAQLEEDEASEKVEAQANDEIDFDFDIDEEPDLSADFDLADEDAKAPEVDENAIDFDFVIEEPEAAVDKVEEPSAEIDAAVKEDDGNEIEFEFEISDDFASDVAKVEVLDDPADEDSAAEEDVSFDLDVKDDEEAEIEFLDEVDEDDNIAFDDASFDLSIDDEPEASEPATQSATNETQGDELDDLQFVDDSLEEATSDDAEDEDEDEDFDFLSDADEASTKLDLARAYFEMGDVEGAKEILEEVLDEGNEEQVKDAKELLEKL